MLALPFGLWVTTLLVGMIGLWNVFHGWNRQVSTQLAIDRCVARVAREFRDLLGTIETSNSRIRILRASLLAAVEPTTRAGLQTALALASAHQDFALGAWQAKRVRWLLPGSCPGARSILPLDPLPTSPWKRAPPDALGPLPSSWVSPIPPASAEFRVALRAPPRSTRAFVRMSAPAASWGKHDGSRWVATWRPRGPGPD